MIPTNKKANNTKIGKLNYICYDKIKSIPKKNYIPRQNSNKNKDIYNYNDSIKVDSKFFKKIRKINKNSLKNKPLLSERIKKNSLKKKSKEIKLGSITVQKSRMNNVNKTDNNNALNLIDIENYKREYLNSGFNDSNVKHIFDQNIIINNNNYDKKIIFYGENDNYNKTFNKNSDINGIHPYNLQNNKLNRSKNENSYLIPKNNNNMQGLNLSESSINNYNFQTVDNLNKIRNINIIKENLNLKSDLGKFLKENYDLKLKMNSLQNKGGYKSDVHKFNYNKDIFFKKQKYLSYKKSWDISNKNQCLSELNDEEYNCQTTERKNKINCDKKTKPHQINTIYDSMQFKIKKRKLSLNYNNVNKNIDFDNSLGKSNLKSNENKYLLMNDSYNRVYENELGKEMENINYYGEEENKIKEDSVNLEHIIDLKASKSSMNLDDGQPQQRNNILKQEFNILNNKYKSLTKENSELQQKYNSLYNINELVKKKNEIYLKCIDEQQKKIKTYENDIKFLNEEINNKYKKTEEDLLSKLNKANEIINEYENKIKTMQKDMQNMREENYSLYKFKSSYSDKEIEFIETKNELRKLENISNKYDTLKFNYDALLQENTKLKDIENKYRKINSELDKLNDIEEQYNSLNNKYNELIQENNDLKEAKQRLDELNENNNKINELKMKNNKLNDEVVKLREIREKYHQILKEQNDLLIIQNKYNDLNEEVQELKEYKIKYDNILFNQGNQINSTEIEKELSKKIEEIKNLNKKLEDISNNQNVKIEYVADFILNKKIKEN